jgi:cytochrome c-type biogenesis protein CcmH/NrfG
MSLFALFWQSAIRLLFKLLFSGLISILAIGSYWQLSGKHYRAHQLAENKKAELTKALKQYKDPDEIIEKMKAHLVSDPTSAKGWYLLGRLYSSKKQYQSAMEAYTHAYQLDKTNRDYAFQYLALKNYLEPLDANGKLDKLADSLEKRFPKDIEILNFIAQKAYRAKHYQKAIVHWQKIIPLVPEGSEDYKWLLSTIEQAKASLNT